MRQVRNLNFGIGQLSAPMAKVLAAIALFTCTAHAANLPALPQTFSTTYAAPSGNRIVVNAGGNLQAALTSAQPGDTIVLQAGASFTGPFTLPNKSGSSWIYVQSSAYANLPGPGNRVGISDAANMPKLLGTVASASALDVPSGAHHFRFVGIEFAAAAGKAVTSLIGIGGSDTSTSTLAHDIVFDRCYMHPDSSAGGRRAITMDGAYIAVVDSYLSEWKTSDGSDSQAILAYNTPGPLRINNNYLEAASENINFGGVDNAGAAFVPADIEITNNTISKPLSWMNKGFNEKNLLEFKMAKRVLVSGNRFQNAWAESQAGWAIILSPRNQSGGNPWAVVSDITITDNVLANIGHGIRVGGHDDTYPSQQTARVLLKDNLIDVTGLNTNGYGWTFGILGDPVDVTIDHNTGIIEGQYSVSSAYLIADYQNSPASGIVNGKAANVAFTNNLLMSGMYGSKGAGTSDGLSTFSTFFSSYVLANNALIGSSASVYPAGNFFPASPSAVQFVSFSCGSYQLAAASPYKRAGTDGADLGASQNTLARYSTSTCIVPAPPTSLSVN